jgi:hypothetical protein
MTEVKKLTEYGSPSCCMAPSVSASRVVMTRVNDRNTMVAYPKTFVAATTRFLSETIRLSGWTKGTCASQTSTVCTAILSEWTKDIRSRAGS